MESNPNPDPAYQQPLSSTPPTPQVSSAPAPTVITPTSTSPDPSPQSIPAPANPVGMPTPASPVPPAPALGATVSGSFGPQPSSRPVFQPQTAAPLANGPKRRLPKAVLISVAAVAVLGFASAAAFFGVVVPNQPANQLKTALVNTLQEEQASFKGTVTADDTAGEFSMKLDLDGKYDTTKKATAVTTGITVSGVKLNIEVRYVGSSIYIKTSDLNTIATLAAGYSPEIGDMVKSVSGTISNKWIEVDSTLLKQAGASCVLDSNWSLTNKDVDLLTKHYKDNEFATIKSTSSESVNGLATTKFNITVDNKKADKYLTSLTDLSLFKTLKDCPGGEDINNKATSTSSGNTDLTIWVDKDTKHVEQIGYETPTAQAAKDGTKASLKLNFDYKPVSIDKPVGATPVMDILAQLQTQLSGTGFDLSSLMGVASGTSSKAEDSARQANLNALQTQFEVFYQNNGYYPSLADMNNAKWVSANMKTLDPNALQDPSGTSQSLASAPAAKVIAYQPLSAAGTSCESDHTQCAAYKLTATLSDGKPYVKQNLD